VLVLVCAIGIITDDIDFFSLYSYDHRNKC